MIDFKSHDSNFPSSDLDRILIFFISNGIPNGEAYFVFVLIIILMVIFKN